MGHQDQRPLLETYQNKSLLLASSAAISKNKALIMFCIMASCMFKPSRTTLSEGLYPKYSVVSYYYTPVFPQGRGYFSITYICSYTFSLTQLQFSFTYTYFSFTIYISCKLKYFERYPFQMLNLSRYKFFHSCKSYGSLRPVFPLTFEHMIK